MKKLIRILLAVLGAMVGLVIILMIGLTIFLPVDRMAARLEAELEKNTGAEVAIGDAGLSWWPKLGVTLDDVEFRGTGAGLTRATGAANKIGAYEGKADKLQVQVPIGPLLKRQVVVEAASLQGVDLQLEHGGDNLKLQGGRVDIGDLQMDLENLPAATPEGSPVGQRIPADLVLDFQGQADSYTQKGQELQNIRFHGGLDTRILTVEEIIAEIGGGQLQGNLEIDYERDARGLLDFGATADKVAAPELLVAYVPALASRLKTDLNGQVRGHMVLGEKPVMLSSLTLTGDLSSGEGELQARDWLKDVLPYLGSRKDLVDIQFDRLQHALRVEQGRYHVDDLVIDGRDTHWQVGGSVGLDGDLDLKVKILLPAGFTPDLGQWSMLADALRDEDGRVKLDLSVRGKGSQPEVGLNLGTLKDAAQSDAGEAVQKGLGGLLDKWKSR